MNPNIPPKIHRLLGDYERITRDQGAALRTRDFATFHELREFKAEVVAALVKEAAAAGIDRRVTWFNERLMTLAMLERVNSTFAERVMAQLQAERKQLDAARKRIRSLGHAYRSGSRSSRLFALS